MTRKKLYRYLREIDGINWYNTVYPIMTRLTEYIDATRYIMMNDKVTLVLKHRIMEDIENESKVIDMVVIDGRVIGGWVIDEFINSTIELLEYMENKPDYDRILLKYMDHLNIMLEDIFAK